MITLSKNVAATGSVVNGAGSFHGIIVNSHSSGTLRLWDSIGGGQNALTGTYTFAAGSNWLMLPEPLEFKNGLYATVGGTLDCQILVS